MDFGIYSAYYAYPKTILAIIIPISSMLILYLNFRRTHSPKARSWSLGLMLLSSIFLWLFLGLSLAFCYGYSKAYEFELEAALAAVFSRALLIAVGAGLPLAILLRKVSPRMILGRVKELRVPNAEAAGLFDGLRNTMALPHVELRLSKTIVPISFAADDADKPVVVMSERLLSLLNNDELEAVMAHELAHVKNSDTRLKALVTAYKAALPHDPVIRLVEAAFHREREMAADETAVRVTQKPLSLASALLKIYEAFPKRNLRAYGTLSILGAGSSLLGRHPPINYRISQLIRLAETQR